MATFRSPAYQATHVMQQMQGTALRSVGTVRNYEQALNRVAEWAQRQRHGRTGEQGRAEAL